MNWLKNHVNGICSRKINIVLKFAVITSVMLSSASCSSKIPNTAFVEESTRPIPIATEAETAAVSATGSEQVTWENYLSEVIKKRELNLLHEQDTIIDLDEYLKNENIKIKADAAEIDALKSLNVFSYLIDLDKDNIDELCLIQSEGSIRNYYTKIFKKENDAYTEVSTTDGCILPVRYNNNIHFISIEYDFQTKFSKAIIEYDLEGLALKQKDTLDINYSYDVSELPKSIKDIVDNEYLNLLAAYKMPESDLIKISRTPGAQTKDLLLTDEKNANVFKFTVELWETSVGYAPNQWYLESKDDSTLKFKGMDQVVTDKDSGTDESVCFGFKFHKDESNNIYLLKVSYPFFTSNARKDGDLLLQLFKFNKASVEKIEEKIIEPDIEVNLHSV